MNNWKNMPKAHKIAAIIGGIAAVAAVLGFVLKWDSLPVDVTSIAIAVFTLCEAVIEWKKNRKMAYLFIAAAVISLAFCVLEAALMLM